MRKRGPEKVLGRMYRAFTPLSAGLATYHVAWVSVVSVAVPLAHPAVDQSDQIHQVGAGFRPVFLSYSVDPQASDPSV